MVLNCICYEAFGSFILCRHKFSCITAAKVTREICCYSSFFIRKVKLQGESVEILIQFCDMGEK